MLPLLIIVGLGYLAGSVPFGYLLLRVFRGRDVRESGSGNIGATNVARSSPWLGLCTLLLDAGKGAAAVAAAVMMNEAWRSGPPVSVNDKALAMAVAALSAVLGHVFPAWLKFKGGKGVATALGSFALIAPKAMLIAVGIFVVALVALRYVSFASILAVASFPLFAWHLREYHQPLVLALLAACSFMIVLKHHENIGRLLGGTESRFQLRRA